MARSEAGPEAEVGSLEWGRETRGQLSHEERRALRLAMLRDTKVYLRSRLLHAVGRGSHMARCAVDVMDMPDTSLCRAVESAVSASVSPQMLGHSYRTVAYAHALASIDRVEADPELLWCASLLHDVALEHPVAGQCFAVRGGETAERVALEAGADAATAALLGDTVSRHASPGLDPLKHPLAYLVSNGALVDVVGKRIDEIDPKTLTAVKAARPRGDFSQVLAAAWRGECRAVPHGRAALADRTVLFWLAARAAPR